MVLLRAGRNCFLLGKLIIKRSHVKISGSALPSLSHLRYASYQLHKREFIRLIFVLHELGINSNLKLKLETLHLKKNPNIHFIKTNSLPIPTSTPQIKTPLFPYKIWSLCDYFPQCSVCIQSK